MRMKSGSWIGFLILVGLGLLTSCSTHSSTSSGTGALFVTTQGNALVSPFSVDLSKGSISANGTGIATGVTPSAIVLTPSGDAAFVANRDSNDISRYTIKSDDISVFSISSGAGLTEIAGSRFPAASSPVSVAITASGSFLYVANDVSG